MGRITEPVPHFRAPPSVLLKTGGSGLPAGSLWDLYDENGTRIRGGIIDANGTPVGHPFSSRLLTSGFPCGLLEKGTIALGQVEALNDTAGIVITAGTGIVLTADGTTAEPACRFPIIVKRPTSVVARVAYAGTPAADHFFELRLTRVADADWNGEDTVTASLGYDGSWKIYRSEYVNGTETLGAGVAYTDGLTDMMVALTIAPIGNNSAYSSKIGHWDGSTTVVHTSSRNSSMMMMNSDTETFYVELVARRTAGSFTATVKEIYVNDAPSLGAA